MGKEDARERLSEKMKRWSDSVGRKLAKAPERRASFNNTSGIPVERIYSPLDVKD